MAGAGFRSGLTSPVAVADGGTGASTAAGARTAMGVDDLYAQAINTRRRIYAASPTGTATFQTISDTAYFFYVGYTNEAVTPKFVEFFVTTVGVGTQAAEVGLFSTPLAPNKSGQTLTKLAANSTLDDITTGAVLKRNTSAMSTQVAAGVHLWVGIRFAMSVTQPILTGYTQDWATGQILATTTAGALTGAGPWVGAILTAVNTTNCPRLTMTLD